MTAKTRCMEWGDRDRSPESCRKRAELLRATIPLDVMRRVVGQKVIQAGISPAKFAGLIRYFAPPTTLDDSIHRLANGSCLGMLSGFIAFQDGGRLEFEVNTYKEYVPAARLTHKRRQRKVTLHQKREI